MRFGYEDLDVWNKAVDFAVDVIDTVDNISPDRKHYCLLEQTEASSCIHRRLEPELSALSFQL